MNTEDRITEDKITKDKTAEDKKINNTEYFFEDKIPVRGNTTIDNEIRENDGEAAIGESPENSGKASSDGSPENSGKPSSDGSPENSGKTRSDGSPENTESFEISEKLLQDPRLGEAFIKRANSEICRLGMFFGVKIGLYSCACMLLVGYVMCIINHAHNALPLQTAFFCLFLPPVLNFFRKRADAKDPFVLETLKKHQKYSIEKYRIYNLTYFVIITGLALWLKVLFGTEGDILYIPAFSILAAVAGRILATAGYIIITKIRLSRGKVTK